MAGELFDQVVGVLFTAWFAGMSEEILNGLAALVEELDEDDDAVGGDVGRVAELLDLFFGEGGVVFFARGGGGVGRATPGGGSVWYGAWVSG